MVKIFIIEIFFRQSGIRMIYFFIWLVLVVIICAFVKGAKSDEDKG